MFRSCGDAASSKDSLTIARRSVTTGAAASSSIVVSAPTRSSPPSATTPRSGSRVMSISTSGASTPSFIRSTCVVPPARNAAAGPAAAAVTAWRTSVARTYSNGCTAQFPRGRTDRRDDIRVSATPADVAAHELADLFVGARPPLGKQRHRRHDLPGRAVPALERVTGDERALQRVQSALACQPLDRGDLAALAGDRERQARQHPLAVRQHGARAARPLIAALLGPGQPQPLPQRVKQRDPRVQAQLMEDPVDPQQRRQLRRYRPGIRPRPSRLAVAIHGTPIPSGRPLTFINLRPPDGAAQPDIGSGGLFACPPRRGRCMLCWPE